MGHGDLNDNISDVSSNPVLVQDVTDAFCHATGDVAKVNISHVQKKKINIFQYTFTLYTYTIA